MEKTLDVINENRSRMDLGSLSERIKVLEKERKNNIQKLNRLKVDLKNARLNEYRPIIIGGQEFKPKDCGKFINDRREDASWVPLPVESGISLNLSNQEIADLYLSNELVSKEEEIEFDSNLPKIEELIAPIEFSKLVSRKNTFDSDELNYGKELWENKEKNLNIVDLAKLKDRLIQAMQNVDIEKVWMLEIIENSKEELLKKNWENLIEQVEKVYNMAMEYSEDILNYNPQFIGTNKDININQQLEMILKKLECGKKISKFDLLINKQLKDFINSCRVNGNIPSDINEFQALKNLYSLQNEREKLRNRWNRQIAPLGVQNTDDMGEEFETICIKYVPVIKENINWYIDVWENLKKDIKKTGLAIERFENRIEFSNAKYSEIKHIKGEVANKIIAAISSEIARMEYATIQQDKEKLEIVIDKYVSNRQSKIMLLLQEAVINDDVSLYKDCYDSIIAINEISGDILKRRKLLDKLGKCAPIWAEKIRNRSGQFGLEKVPENINDAWKYAQFKQELEKRNSDNLETIQNEILEIEKTLRQNTSELAFNKAWLYKLTDFERNKAQVRAIEGWRQIIRKIGQGKVLSGELNALASCRLNALGFCSFR